MQLTPFVLILGILFRITLDAYAIPLTRKQKGVVTVPLKRTSMRRDLHPQMLFQMHNARAQRRLARMTGRAVKEDDHPTVRGVAHTGFSKLGNKPNEPSTGKAPTSELAVDAASEGFSTADLQALEENTLTPANTPTISDALGLDIEGSDVGYIMTIQIGTPPRNFGILMDTGSADFWVGGEGCQTANGDDCGNHEFLGTESSSSFTELQQNFNVTYGSGAVQGPIVQDNVVIAGLPLPAHIFGVATEETPNFAANGTLFDGIMGLAQSTLSNQHVLTPVETLAKKGLIQQAILGIHLGRVADGENDGEVTFGGLDGSKFDSSTLVTLENVSKEGFWEADIDSVSVDGQDLNLTASTAILDTGTTLFIVPPGDAQAIHDAIPGSKKDGNGGFTLPCTTNSTLALQFGGQLFSIDPRDITVSPVDPNDPTGDCISGISPGEVDGPLTLLAGDVFLKNVYFSTNVEKNTIQLAKLTNS